MLTLYVKTGCAYCAVALKKLNDLGLEFEEKNIADPGVREELIDKGGKQQVPYLVDTENLMAMYESAAIEAYLEEFYGGKDEVDIDDMEFEVKVAPATAVTSSGIRLHRQDDADICESCQ